MFSVKGKVMSKRGCFRVLQTCGNYDKDECLEWSKTTSWEEGTTCLFECKKTCENECVSGKKRCAGNGYQECGNFYSDPCREWSLVTSCGQDQTCKNGVCVLPSNDKCEDAFEITQSGTWDGDTGNYTDDRQPWCTSCVQGKDAYFRLKLKKKANITLDLTGTKFEAVLSLSTKCGRDYKETCKRHNPSGTPAIIRKDNFGPTEDYYIIVDGKCNFDEGEYTLTMT
jgi:hypothetical protein